MSRILDSALRAQREDAQITAANSLARDDRSITTKEIKVKPQVIAGRFASLKTDVVRNVDLFRLQTARRYGSTTDYHKSILDGLKEVQDSISVLQPGQQPKLIEPITDFFRQVNIAIQDPTNHSLKNVCVESGIRIAKILNHTSQSCYEAMSDSQLKLHQEILELNKNISELAHINFEIAQEFSLGHRTDALLDRRDALVSNISSAMSIETPKYGYDGTVLVSSGGFVLVQKSEFSVLEFNPNDTESIKAGLGINKIHIKKMMYNGRNDFGGIDGRLVDRSVFYDPSAGPKMKSGKIRGLIDLHQTHLPAYISTIDAVSANLCEQVNRVHNSGSTYPGRSEILGISKKAVNSRSIWGGSAKIALVQAEDGRPVKTGSTTSSFLKLDLAKLSQVSESGALTPRMIVDEINNHFGISHGDAIGMGQQGEEHKFLLHDVSAVISKSDDTQLRFDFEGLNTSDFGTDFEIVGVDCPAGTSILGNLPDKARIERGEKTRTFQTITMDKGGLIGPQTIKIKFRVRGDNGVVNEGKLSFKIDFSSQIKSGTRISPMNDKAAGDYSGDFEIRDLDRANYISASFLNDKGSDAKGDEEGRIVLKVNDQSHRIVIQDDDSQTSMWLDGFGAVKRGFGHFFGLNNFFVSSDKKGKYALDMQVRSDIESDPALFSSTRLLSPATRRVAVSKGSAHASARIELNSGAGGGFINGETITVNGKTFTFGAGPGQIPLGLDFNGSFTELLNRLNSDRDLSGILSFSREGDSLIMTAKTPGVSGNKIKYSSGLTGVVTGETSLAGGADTIVQEDIPELGLQSALSTTQLYSDMIRIDKSATFLNSTNLNYGFGSITVLATLACNSLTGMYENVENSHNINKTVLDKIVDEYKNNFGFDENDQTEKLMRISDMMRYLAFSKSILRDAYSEVIRIMTR